MDRSDWRQRLAMAGLGLAILAVAWYLLKLDWIITVTIAGVIIIPALLPPKIGELVSALGWFVIAGVVWKFYTSSWQLPALLAIVGAVFLAAAVARIVREQGAQPGQG